MSSPPRHGARPFSRSKPRTGSPNIVFKNTYVAYQVCNITPTLSMIYYS